MAVSKKMTRFRGCVVVLSLNITFLLYGGLNKVFGVLMPELREQMASDTWLLGWVITMIGASVQGAGLLTGPLTGVFGERKVFVVSAVLAVLGLIGAFFSSGLLTLTLSVVLLTGTGLGIIVCLAKALLGKHFTKRLSLAAGISTTGLPLSYMIFPPLAQLLEDVYGWRGTLLILSGLMAFLIPCGYLVRTKAPTSGNKEDGYQELPSSAEPHKAASDDHQKSCDCGRTMEMISVKTDFELFKNVMMWSHIVTYCLFGFVNNSWVIFMVPYAQTKGFPPFTATSFSIIAGMSSMVANILQGIVVSRQIIYTRGLIAFGAAIGCLSLVLCPFLHSYGPLAGAMTLYGVSHGILYPGLVCFVIEEQGKQRAANAFGWTGFMSGLFRLMFGFSTGLLYDYTGSYDHTFIFLGSLLGLMVPFFFLDKILSDCCRPKKI